MISKVLIIANGTKAESLLLADEIISFLDENGIGSYLVSTRSCSERLSVPLSTDLVITLGGDGTVLYAARAVHDLGIPILPVNLGTFGYITEVGKSEWKETLTAYMANGENISRRLMLRIAVLRSGKKVWQASALNEAVISSSGIAKVISLELSLEAGGPIIDSEMSAVIITPVCPFTLSNRPLVTSGKVVSLTVPPGQRTDLVLTADGQLDFPLEEGDRVTVEKSRSRVLLVRSLKRNFTEVIRDKLHWSGAMHA